VVPASAPESTAPTGAGLVQASTNSATSPASVGDIYLQLGAFSARDKAESLRARVQRELSWLTSVVEIVEKGGLFRLQTGPYRSRADADSVSDRIRAALELKSVVVVR
jgi:rare lipoprotein A